MNENSEDNKLSSVYNRAYKSNNKATNVSQNNEGGKNWRLHDFLSGNIVFKNFFDIFPQTILIEIKISEINK